jgi:membrane protein implicated in regulation of membrane protease activity
MWGMIGTWSAVLAAWVLGRVWGLGPLEAVLPAVVVFFLVEWLQAVWQERAVARGRSPVWHALEGREARVVAPFQAHTEGFRGHVLLNGERWWGRCDAPLQPGERTRVRARDGLVLVVERIG